MRIAALVLLVLVATALAAKKDKKDSKKKVGGWRVDWRLFDLPLTLIIDSLLSRV